MAKNDGEIDWLNMSAAERIEPPKALYAVLGAIAKTSVSTIDEQISLALGRMAGGGLDYASNFRKGKIAAAKAKAVHRYLEENHFEQAKETAPELFQTNPKSAWDGFVEDYAITGKLRVIPLTKQMGIAQRSKEVQKSAITIRLGQDYSLELDSSIDGHCVAFEGYQGQWYPLPLGVDTRRLRVEVHTGVQRLPRDTRGDPIALVELNDGGEHQFVVVIAIDHALPTDRREILKLETKATSLAVHLVTVHFK